MEKGDKAEHQGHTAPFVTRQAIAQGYAGDVTHDLVHGSPLPA